MREAEYDVIGAGPGGEVAAGRLWDAVPSFPTRSEVWVKLLEVDGL